MNLSYEPLLHYYFYTSVILFYERTVRRSPTGLRITDHDIFMYLKANNIYPKVFDNKSKISVPDGFGVSEASFIHCRKNSKYSILVSVLEHFRNCFAHGSFTLRQESQGLFVEMTDYSTYDKCFTMFAQMPFSVFWGLINMITNQVENARRKQNDNC